MVVCFALFFAWVDIAEIWNAEKRVLILSAFSLKIPLPFARKPNLLPLGRVKSQAERHF